MSNDENYARGCLKPERARDEAHQEYWWRQVITARVERGAAWCDQEDADNARETALPWFTAIDLGTLDMSECDRCIMGQIYGNFIFAPLPPGGTRDMGFDVWRSSSWDDALETIGDPEYFYLAPDGPEEFALLGWAWRNEINARRQAARIVPSARPDCICDLSVQSCHTCEPLYGTTF